MRLFPFINLTQLASAMALSAVLGTVLPAAGEGTPLQFSGAGWTQFGMIVSSLDTLQGKHLSGRAALSSGAQFGLAFKVSEDLGIEAGLGAVAGHSIAAQNTNGFYAPMGVTPYVSAASAKYTFWNSSGSELNLKVGLFPYDYAPDAQNLGLYLVRGPVYPGFLMSGFETKYVMPVANMLGVQIHQQIGSVDHDVLFNVETDWYPYWDISPIYVINYKPTSAFRFGAGVNFNHFISIDKLLTSDTIAAVKYIEKTPVGVAFIEDTTLISFKGIKVMSNFSFDPKALIGDMPNMGPEDLKIYGEAAIIGIDNDKAHRQLYGEISNRMPVMVGFNLPTFKKLDRLAFEVEHYGAKWADNPSIYNHTSGNKPTPIPLAPQDSNISTAKDDIKWSLYGSKTIHNHVKLSFQVASDHYRPGLFVGYGDNRPPDIHAVLLSPTDWYWTTKIAYFF